MRSVCVCAVSHLRGRIEVSFNLSGKLSPVLPDAAGCRTRSSPQARMMPKRCKDIVCYQSVRLAGLRLTRVQVGATSVRGP